MKKNMYLWVFIAVAVVLCGIILVISRDISKEDEIAVPAINTSVSNVNQNKGIATDDNQEKLDLSQIDVDFEEDADDLADDIVDDSQFDKDEDLNSIENEVY